MADDDAQIWIYRYRYWDADRHEMVLSDLMATADAIKDGLGIVAYDTAQKVCVGDVDEFGRYRKRGEAPIGRPAGRTIKG